MSPQTRDKTLRRYRCAIEDVRRYIDHNYQSEVNLDHFCQDLGYSRRSVQRALRHYNTSWQLLLRTQRMRKASFLLLTTGWDVKTIASQVGYCHAAHFAKYFRMQYGSSPSEFRREFIEGRENGKQK